MRARLLGVVIVVAIAAMALGVLGEARVGPLVPSCGSAPETARRAGGSVVAMAMSGGSVALVGVESSDDIAVINSHEGEPTRPVPMRWTSCGPASWLGLPMHDAMFAGEISEVRVRSAVRSRSWLEFDTHIGTGGWSALRRTTADILPTPDDDIDPFVFEPVCDPFPITTIWDYAETGPKAQSMSEAVPASELRSLRGRVWRMVYGNHRLGADETDDPADGEPPWSVASWWTVVVLDIEDRPFRWYVVMETDGGRFGVSQVVECPS